MFLAFARQEVVDTSHRRQTISPTTLRVYCCAVRRDARKRRNSMAIELPLFPLDVVLFPGENLPLHIFEPRYRLMINECYQEEKPFGIVLKRPESEHLQEEPYAVGTMAEIVALDHLEDGRMNLIARG